MLMVTMPVSGINADKNLLPFKNIGPLFKRINIVERNVDPQLKSTLVLLPRCKVGRKENISRVDIGKQLQHFFNFPDRNTLKSKIEGSKLFEHLGVRICLHGIERPIYRIEPFYHT